MITTKTGDKGWTGFGGKRVRKDSGVIEAIGTVDELQAVIQLINYELRITNLDTITNDLYLIMGKKFNADRTRELEKEIKKLEGRVKVCNRFLIFKKRKAVILNWVRTIARRAERKVVSLRNYQLSIINYQTTLQYLNRLSDYLYLLARKAEEK